MKLSSNFYLQELVKSQTAARYGINNYPDLNQIDSLRKLCDNILQPVRDHFKQPVIVSSGYRSRELNARIGGSRNSQHCKGQAVDFEIPGISNLVVASWIRENLDYDQLILEHWNKQVTNSGWIHCSYTGKNRKQALKYNGINYYGWA